MIRKTGISGTVNLSLNYCSASMIFPSHAALGQHQRHRPGIRHHRAVAGHGWAVGRRGVWGSPEVGSRQEYAAGRWSQSWGPTATSGIVSMLPLMYSSWVCRSQHNALIMYGHPWQSRQSAFRFFWQEDQYTRHQSGQQVEREVGPSMRMLRSIPL